MANLWDKNNLQLTADEQQQILPFLLMGSQAQGPQMSLAQPLDQTMSVSTPPAISSAVQPVLPESSSLTPPPTQQDLSMGAAGAPLQKQPSDYSSQVAQAYESQMQALRSSVGDAEARLKQAMQQKEQMNLAPLAQLVDAWTGSRFAPMYQAPESKAKQVQQLQDAVLKARLGVSQTELERLKTLQDQREKELGRQSAERIAGLKLSAAGEAAGEKGTRADIKMQTEMKRDFNKTFGQQMTGLAEMAKNAKIARDIVEKKGRLPIFGDPEYADYKSAVSQLLTTYNRDKAGLGALAGADLRLLESATGTSVSSFENLVTNTFGSGSVGSIKVLDKILSGTDQTIDNIGKSTKSIYPDFVMPTYDQARSIYQESRGLGQKANPTLTADQLKNMSREEKIKAAQAIGK